MEITIKRAFRYCAVLLAIGAATGGASYAATTRPPAVPVSDVKPLEPAASKLADPRGPARSYDKAAVPGASAALEKAQQDCKARLAAKEIQTYSEFAACGLTAEHAFFTAIQLKRMDAFETYADSYQALAADRDTGRVSDEQAGHRVSNLLSRFYRHCNCDVRRRGFAWSAVSDNYQDNFNSPDSGFVSSTGLPASNPFP